MHRALLAQFRSCLIHVLYKIPVFFYLYLLSLSLSLSLVFLCCYSIYLSIYLFLNMSFFPIPSGAGTIFISIFLHFESSSFPVQRSFLVWHHIFSSIHFQVQRILPIQQGLSFGINFYLLFLFFYLFYLCTILHCRFFSTLHAFLCLYSLLLNFRVIYLPFYRLSKFFFLSLFTCSHYIVFFFFFFINFSNSFLDAVSFFYFFLNHYGAMFFIALFILSFPDFFFSLYFVFFFFLTSVFVVLL
ncbi:unnamed protein product [Acanthosepion pharaonis]|uniref:Uncharacterized protein n=1 Tax=Acanthosepion pharaonis TaxID=158019 RepID=A0A812CA91_ACAPH|nr:unnamed protein product [Sepia pharaonis]